MEPELDEPTRPADQQNHPVTWEEAQRAPSEFGPQHNRYRANADLKTQHQGETNKYISHPSTQNVITFS
jgi:hypothetical protein